jgi:hypothetical protein
VRAVLEVLNSKADPYNVLVVYASYVCSLLAVTG